MQQHARRVTCGHCYMHFKFQFGGESPLTMRHELHSTLHCPAPLDPELLCKFQFVVPSSATLRLPCVKGAVSKADRGIVKSNVFTTPPSEIKDFAHLPLHRGGFGCGAYRSDKYQFNAQKHRLWKTTGGVLISIIPQRSCSSKQADRRRADLRLLRGRFPETGLQSSERAFPSRQHHSKW